MNSETKKKISTNIIFDIGGVLFQSMYKDQNTKYYVPLERGIEMLKKCYDQKDNLGNKLHNLYILSNWKTPNFHLLSQEYAHIFNLFDGIVISGDLQFAKPDTRIYEHLLKQFQLDVETCIFIDDLFDNVEAAKHVGMQGIHCLDFDVVEQELSILNVL